MQLGNVILTVKAGRRGPGSYSKLVYSTIGTLKPGFHMLGKSQPIADCVISRPSQNSRLMKTRRGRPLPESGMSGTVGK